MAAGGAATYDRGSMEAAAPPPLPAVSPSLDASGRLAVDFHCRVCGYNLRGQAFGGACSECGAAVAASISDLLRHSDPAWVGRLARGMTLIAWALGGVFGLVVLWFLGAMAAGAAEQVSGSGAAAEQVAIVFSAFSMLGGFALLVTALVGVWWITDREPSQHGREPALTARSLARLGLILGTIVYVGSSVAYVLAPTAAMLAGLASPVLLLVGFLALCRRLRQLAFRLPDRGLATQTRIVFWGLVGLQVMAVVLLAVFVIAFMAMWANAMGGSGSSGGAGWSGSLFGVTMVVSMIGACVWAIGGPALLIWQFVLALIYRRRFRDAAALAEQHLRGMVESAPQPVTPPGGGGG